MEKKSYISAPEGELNISIVRAERPEVTISLDLGIPNFTVFSLKFPMVEAAPQGMQEMVMDGVRALLDEVASFMISLNYEEDVIIELYASVLQCFSSMTNESDTMAQFSDVSRDPTIKTYEGTFKMPIDFINETQRKVVTGAGKILQRQPQVRHLELTTVRPSKNDLGDVARVIRQYKNRSLRQQPKPLYVVVYDSQGRATGTLPLGNNFKNKLFQMMKSSRSVTLPEFTDPVNVQSEIDLKMTNAPGIPKSVTLGHDMYFPEAFSGDDMALYRCQSGGAAWVVKFSDGRLVQFANRPSLQALRSKNYPVPQRYYRWNLIREEAAPQSNESEEVVNALNTGGDPN